MIGGRPSRGGATAAVVEKSDTASPSCSIPALSGPTTTKAGVWAINGPDRSEHERHTALMAAVAAADVTNDLLERNPMYIGIGALLLIIILVVVFL